MKEAQNIEWKQSWRDEYLRWICGFANAEGGTLAIGKNDCGEVVGVANASKLLVDIPNKVRDVLGIVVAVNLHAQAGGDWLEIVVDAYPSSLSDLGSSAAKIPWPVHISPLSRPIARYWHCEIVKIWPRPAIFSLRLPQSGRLLARSATRANITCAAAVPSRSCAGRHWDGVPVPHVGMADLEPRAVQAFRKLAAKSGRLSAESLAESDALLVEKLRLTEVQYLKRASTLLFHADPEKFTSGACVKIGFFRTDSDLLYHDVIEGDLFTQVEKTLDLLLSKYLRAGISYQGAQRLERFPVPEAALREAVINAIAHKDYGAAIPIQISVYDRKLIIWNAGQLPSAWSLDRLMAKHPSQPANPDIARAFFLSGLIESWGRGIELIRNTCLSYGSPEPRIDCDCAGFWVEFPFALGESADSPRKLGDGLGDGLGDTPQAFLLQLIRAKPTISIIEMSQQLIISATAVEKTIKRLKTKGMLQRIGSARSGHWEVLDRPQ